MVKQILILLILLVTCFLGRASNNGDCDFHGDIPSPAVRNSMKFNYDQLVENKNFDQLNFSDDFNLPQLRSLWQSNMNENVWSLKERPGFLRVKAQKINKFDEFSPENIFSQKVRNNASSEAVCIIDLTNLSENSNAGLYFSSNRMNYIGIETYNKSKRLIASVDNETYLGTEISVNSVILRLKIENSRGCFEFSFDGLIYEKLGSEFQIKTLSSGDDCIGFYCYNLNNRNGFVDIDWFYFNQRKDNETKFAELEHVISYPEL